MTTRALIIANGTMPPRRIVRKFLGTAGAVICADGGANHARRYQIRPDVILGDLDSISSATLRHFPKTPTLLLADQESTDLEKAIAYCIQKRFTHVDIIGGTGDRIDHTIGNLGCFKKFGKLISIRLIDGRGTLEQVRRHVRLKLKKGELVSLIPLDRCTGVATQNLKYSLRNEPLELGVREGTSNVAMKRNVSIRVRQGTLLYYIFHRR